MKCSPTNSNPMAPFSMSEHTDVNQVRPYQQSADDVAAGLRTHAAAGLTSPEALARLADEDRRYTVARKRALAAMKSARSLGTRGRRTWTRDELHER